MKPLFSLLSVLRMNTGQQYVYMLPASNTYTIPELNTGNNTASVLFTKP